MNRDTCERAAWEFLLLVVASTETKNQYVIDLEAVTTMSRENPSLSIHLVRCRSPKCSSRS